MKKYGIRFTLPENDPMRKPHLLGDDWEAYRWYDSEDERDEAFREAERKFPYYRIGDYPSYVLTRVEE